jgi:uncharacterized protein YjbI with pentapeptide repeats
MDNHEFLERYTAGRRDFTWIDLTEANLTAVKLTGINLSRSNLTKAILVKADLSLANLVKTNFSQANLQQANLTNATLYKTNFSGAKLQGANLTGTDLSKANLTGAIMPDGRIYEKWKLSHPVETIPSYKNKQLVATEKPVASYHRVHIYPHFEMINVSEKKAIPEKLKIPEFWKKLPLPAFLMLWLGYICFGALLTIQQTPVLAWIFAWGGSLIWLIDESWIWFVPVPAVLAVMASASISVISLFIVGIVTITMILGMIFLDFGVKKAIKDGLWLGTFAGAAMLIAQWLSVGRGVYSGGGVVFRGILPTGLVFFLAIVTAIFGSVAWMGRNDMGFSKQQNLISFASVTGIGLLCGWVIERMF